MALLTRMISAVSINLGRGKSDVLEAERSDNIEEFVKKVAAEHQPDIVFSQDSFANIHIQKLIPALTNNIAGSNFVLKKNVINENSKDHVGIFLNETKFNIEDIEKDCAHILQNLREQKLDFFDEDKRAIFVLAVTKNEASRFLLASFHAKKNKINDTNREIHIREFFLLLENISKKVRADHILVGSDTNHKMRSFDRRNKDRKFCVKVLLYDYPDYCERKINEKVVYDFFMISPTLTPVTKDPMVFNFPTKYLDHHPIFMQFQYPANYQQVSSKAKETKVTTNPSPSSIPSTAKLPARFQAKDNSKPPSQYNSLSSQYHTQSYQFPEKSPTNTTKQNQYQTKANCSDKLVSSLTHTNSSPAYSSPPSKIFHCFQQNVQSTPNTKLTPTKTPDLRSDISCSTAANSQVFFQCELCERSFETRNGLFIHFGRHKESHYPCKEEFPTELDQNKNVCLRVFKSASAMKQHKTKQMNNPLHHQPGKPFPNLILHQSQINRK